MSNHIFQTQTNPGTEQYFCLKGQEDFIDSAGRPCVNNGQSDRVAAKSILNKKPKHFNSTNQHARYYIKTTPDGVVYNPIHYFKIKDNNKDFINQVCKDGTAFREVNKSIFDKYIQFLSTANIAWLKDVERDIK